MTSDPWGRVDENGTVYVRTADGERTVGSWQAGEPQEALDFFKRKYDALMTEADLLEQRIATTDLAPSQAKASVDRLRASLAEPQVVGDLDALARRIERLDALAAKRGEEVRAARDAARQQAREVKERIVAEAERVAAEATHWKQGGERLRQLVEEWKQAPRIDRPTESALWKRMSAARNQFARRRKAYFADLESHREQARLRKEKLVGQAESLADSTDWGATAAQYRELMREWKAAGRAAKETDDALWARFKAAQDEFFAARSAVFSARDAELRANAEVKKGLLAEAERLLPVKDLRAARDTLRSVQERWDATGPVPRDERDSLEGRLRRVEETVRKAEDNRWRSSNPEAQARARATVDQLNAAIARLEKDMERARTAGDEKAEREAAEALDARRTWLAEAQRTLGELSTHSRG